LRGNIFWSFGDGSSAFGGVARKTYLHPGNYVVVAKINHHGFEATDRVTVRVVPSNVSLERVSSGGYDGTRVHNNTNEEINLFDWEIRFGADSFRFPEDSIVMPRSAIVVSDSIAGFSVEETETLSLYFPSGDRARNNNGEPIQVFLDADDITGEEANPVSLPHAKSLALDISSDQSGAEIPAEHPPEMSELGGMLENIKERALMLSLSVASYATRNKKATGGDSLQESESFIPLANDEPEKDESDIHMIDLENEAAATPVVEIPPMTYEEYGDANSIVVTRPQGRGLFPRFFGWVKLFFD